MRIAYSIQATDEDTDTLIAGISAYSLESLEEQLHKIEGAVKRYEKESPEAIEEQERKYGEERMQLDLDLQD